MTGVRSNERFADQAELILASQRRDARRFVMGVRVAYALLFMALLYAFSGARFTVVGLQFTTITLDWAFIRSHWFFIFKRCMADDTAVGPVDRPGDCSFAFWRAGAIVEVPASLCVGDLLHLPHARHALAPADCLFLPGPAAAGHPPFQDFRQACWRSD